MRRILASLLFAALLGPAQAEETPQASVSSSLPAADAASAPPAVSPALEIMPERLGYAFEKPEILLRQRLFGLAHGLSLLAASCLDLPEHSTPIQDAYAVWHAGQAKAIESLALDLAAHYFGPRAAEAGWQDLARALNLKDSIQPSLGTVSLRDACNSLPEAINQPRYQLDRLLADGAAPVVKAAAAPVAVTTPRSDIATPRSGSQGLQSQVTQGEATQSVPPPSPQRPAE